MHESPFGLKEICVRVRMPGFTVQLSPCDGNGDEIEVQLKGWTFQGSVEELRWDLRDVMKAAGYDVSLKNGAVPARLRDLSGLSSFAATFGVPWQSPNYSNNFTSEVKRMARQGLESHHVMEFEQEYWVSTKGLVTFFVSAITTEKAHF